MANGVMIGAGTIENPYLIEDVDDLKAMSKTGLSKVYKLNNDIDCSSVANFAKLGTTSTGFTGTLDGNGFSIQNLTISSSVNSTLGLFAMTVGAIIKNISFDNCKVTGTKEMALISGRDRGSIFEDITITNSQINASDGYVGFIVARSTSYSTIIRNCKVQGKIISTCKTLAYVGGIAGSIESTYDESIIDNCEVDIVIEAIGQYVGGVIAGTKKMKITNTNAIVYISTEYENGDNFIGGFIGSVLSSNGVEFLNCRVNGTVFGKGDAVGGFVGLSYTTASFPPTLFRNCGVDVDVEGNKHVGGFAGSTNTVVSDYMTFFQRCFAIGRVKGNRNIGGFIGTLYKSSISDCYAIVEIVSEEDDYTGGFVGSFATKSTLTNSYSASTFTELGQGFVGNASEGGLSGCYFDIDVGRPQIAIPGVTPLTTMEMKTQSTFVGWDFDSFWTMIQYPQLKEMVQDDRFGIRGIVMKNGVAVGGATVLLFSEKDRLYRKTISDSKGEWVFKSIVPQRDFVVHAYWSDEEGNRYISSSSPYVLPVELV